MAYTATGTVYIPSEEFWAWVYNTKPELAERDLIVDPKTVILDSVEGALEMTTTEGEVVEIDSIDFWGFVGDYLPVLAPAESRFGPPRFDDSQLDLVIPFCASTESIEHFEHPDHEAIKRSWNGLRGRALFSREA